MPFTTPRSLPRTVVARQLGNGVEERTSQDCGSIDSRRGRSRQGWPPEARSLSTAGSTSKRRSGASVRTVVPARRDGLDRRGDDRPAVGDDLKPEADVDPVLLEEAAAQGCARQPRPGEFREERASANEDLRSE